MKFLFFYGAFVRKLVENLAALSHPAVPADCKLWISAFAVTLEARVG
jgi:hypothetical protein